jgi:adenine phosphoribosyltransferase
MSEITGSDISRIVHATIRDVPDFPSQGILFKDIGPLVSDPVAFAAVIEHWRARHTGQVAKVVGIDARGFIFGGALAHALGVGFVPVRKAGKLPGRTIERSYDLEYGSATLAVQADAFTGGERVVVIDDVLATGGTAHAGLRAHRAGRRGRRRSRGGARVARARRPRAADRSCGGGPGFGLTCRSDYPLFMDEVGGFRGGEYHRADSDRTGPGSAAAGAFWPAPRHRQPHSRAAARAGSRQSSTGGPEHHRAGL